MRGGRGTSGVTKLIIYERYRSTLKECWRKEILDATRSKRTQGLLGGRPAGV